jgi:tRNA (cmo5U34)-methyltransferase
MSRKDQIDTLFQEEKRTIDNFAFDDAVANVFDDMIIRSVPGYRSLISNIGVIAKQYFQTGSNVYDIGCSLGAAILSVQNHIAKNSQGCIFAVDSSASMLSKCKSQIETTQQNLPIQFICDDALNIEIKNASLVILNFTLQFIPIDRRLNLLQKIYDGLLPNGVLVLSEKITLDEDRDVLVNDLHNTFKSENGYSELEISQKRAALEETLLTETICQHEARIREAGFEEPYRWFQCFNFISWITFK